MKIRKRCHKHCCISVLSLVQEQGKEVRVEGPRVSDTGSSSEDK